MNKLKLDVKKGLYEIEVNDKGDTITLDPSDVELPFKMNDAYLSVQRTMEELDEKQKQINTTSEDKHGLVKECDEQLRQLIHEMYEKMRRAVDGFLGDGATQKIFGDRNYPEMYNDLFKALEPHFVKMGLTVENSVNTVKDKYLDKDDDILE